MPGTLSPTIKTAGFWPCHKQNPGNSRETVSTGIDNFVQQGSPLARIGCQLDNDFFLVQIQSEMKANLKFQTEITH